MIAWTNSDRVAMLIRLAIDRSPNRDGIGAAIRLRQQSYSVTFNVRQCGAHFRMSLDTCSASSAACRA